ncbi:hypothetical protein [Neorhodopirellula pilleata]|uniref:Uncharacterized protein n=1 Tax=Neorhodopirellula pilleata TaxID=2714738 RepID=A0A5C6A3T1_9BACT|nr:hypothetical protein [Neorhodopirellula pilleata]TWT93073.1 hypothetical protein Pla100_43900 [Neorhodopirellula pilleata]
MLDLLRARSNGAGRVFSLVVPATLVGCLFLIEMVEGRGADGRVSSDSEAIQEALIWAEALSDDRPATRVRAEEQIGRLVRDADRMTLDRIRQHLLRGLLRAGLNADLESQLSLERLLADLDETQHSWELKDFLEPDLAPIPHLATNLEPSGCLALHWQTFAARAGDDLESRQVFARLAGKAGPSWRWFAIDGQTKDDCDIFISHLGCIAPTEPHYHAVEARVVYRRLDHFEWADRTMSSVLSDSRLLGRLIDRTLCDNPYGWSVEQRLRLALMYRRDATALRIADSVGQSEDRLPVDWAVSMLALRQIQRRSFADSTSGSPQWRNRWQAISESLADRRMLARRPDELLPKVKPSMFVDAAITTRVQDVAAWVLMDRDGDDARQQGMPQLQADSIWGVRRSSIGFATQYERDRQLGDLVKRNSNL